MLTPFLDHTPLGELSTEELAVALAVVAAVFLLTKSVISVVLMRWVFRFLGTRQAMISADLTERLLGRPLLAIESRSSQERAYALSLGVGVLVTATLGAFALVLAEITLLIVLGVVLAVINTGVTVVALVFFASIGFAFQRMLRATSVRIGEELGSTTVDSQQLIQEALAAYREISVLGRRPLIVETISQQWTRAGRARADSLYIIQLPKIAYEAALVVGALGLAAWQFTVADAVQALATLALFLAAGSRVLPSMLRLTNLILGIRTGAGQAKQLFPMILELRDPDVPFVPFTEGSISRPGRLLRSGYEGFAPVVQVDGLSFRYPGEAQEALKDIALRVGCGDSLAVVGSTGAGKSTLADVILGLIEPSEGTVKISGMMPSQAIEQWPGAIAYVPQHVALFNGTVRQNVALAFPDDEIDDELVWAALRRAQLDDFLFSAREGLDTLVGERGVRLSGGQRQRLGLARALYSSPRMLILDEATSALDAETERLIAAALQNLSGDVTLIVIAHRLATIRTADSVVYLENGAIVSRGTFAEVREENPHLRAQAALMGMTD